MTIDRQRKENLENIFPLVRCAWIWENSRPHSPSDFPSKQVHIPKVPLG